MGSLNKLFPLFITVILVASSLLFISLTNAQSMPAPSVPQFTVKFVKIDLSPEANDKVPVVNFTFKSQPFTPYTNQNGNKIDLYYLIDWKRPADSTWIQYNFPFSGLDNNTHSIGMYIYESGIPSQTGQIEFKVAALIGYITPDTPNTTAISETSSWSSTQTITVPVSSSSPTPIAIGSLALTFAISIIAVITAIVITLLLHRRHRKTANVPKVI
jgi:heme/copper-type cytochrome/quinol oxidase subunit 4